MTFLKQNWFKIIFSIICWLLFLWGIFVVIAVLSDSDFSILKDWIFYVFGILPIFAVIFIRSQVKKISFIIWGIVPNREWFYKNWLKLAGLILIIFITTQYLAYLDRKNAFNEEKHREELEQTKREYAAKRKRDCLDIYQAEQKNWSNTRSYEYDDKKDVCRVSYKATNEWEGIKCKDISPAKLEVKFGDFLWDSLWRDYDNCVNGFFDKEF